MYRCRAHRPRVGGGVMMPELSPPAQRWESLPGPCWHTVCVRYRAVQRNYFSSLSCRTRSTAILFVFYEGGFSHTFIQPVWRLFLKGCREGLRSFSPLRWHCPHTVHCMGRILLLSTAGLQPWALGPYFLPRGGSGRATGDSVGKEPGTAPGTGPQLCEAGCSCYPMTTLKVSPLVLLHVLEHRVLRV